MLYHLVLASSSLAAVEVGIVKNVTFEEIARFTFMRSSGRALCTLEATIDMLGDGSTVAINLESDYNRVKGLNDVVSCHFLKDNALVKEDLYIEDTTEAKDITNLALYHFELYLAPEWHEIPLVVSVLGCTKPVDVMYRVKLENSGENIMKREFSQEYSGMLLSAWISAALGVLAAVKLYSGGHSLKTMAKLQCELSQEDTPVADRWKHTLTIAALLKMYSLFLVSAQFTAYSLQGIPWTSLMISSRLAEATFEALLIISVSQVCLGSKSSCVTSALISRALQCSVSCQYLIEVSRSFYGHFMTTAKLGHQFETLHFLNRAVVCGILIQKLYESVSEKRGTHSDRNKTHVTTCMLWMLWTSLHYVMIRCHELTVHGAAIKHFTDSVTSLFLVTYLATGFTE